MMGHSTADPEHSHRKARIIAVIAATGIALSCGTNYAFSAWEPEFAERLELSATQANLIGNFGNIGMYAMGIPGGILIDKKGPRWGVLVGVIGLAVGYFGLHAAYQGGAGSMGVPMLCFFSLSTGIASCTAFSAALKVSATNWPRHRGTATAFPLSAFGLSAFFYTTLSAAVFPDDTAGYLLLLAIVATSMVFIGMIFLRMIPPASPYEALPGDERPGLARKDSNRLRRTSAHSRQTSKSSTRGERGTLDETESLVSSDGPGDLEEGKPYVNRHEHKPEITGWVLLKTPAFWRLFIMLGLLCGVGLMTINNIGNNARSLWHHYDDTASHSFIQKRQVMHVGIISIFSFLGRLSSGIGSDWLIHHGASRFWTLVASASIFTVAQMLGLRIADPNYLFWLSGLTGLGYGALFGVYPALVADAFGPSGMGINWGAMTWAPVLSGNIFNLAYGGILDKHSVVKDGGQAGHHPERVCDDGLSCYASAYWITLVASVAGVVFAMYCIRHEKAERLKEGREEREHEG